MGRDAEHPPTLDKNFRHDIDFDRSIPPFQDRRHRHWSQWERPSSRRWSARSNNLRLRKLHRTGWSDVEHSEGTTISWSILLVQNMEHLCLNFYCLSFNSPLRHAWIFKDWDSTPIQSGFNYRYAPVSNGCVLLKPMSRMNFSSSRLWALRYLTKHSFRIIGWRCRDILLHGSGSTIIHFHLVDNGSV